MCARKNKKENGAIAVIGHPKLIDNVWLNNFDKTLAGLVRKQKIRLTTMQEIGQKLETDKLHEK